MVGEQEGSVAHGVMRGVVTRIARRIVGKVDGRHDSSTWRRRVSTVGVACVVSFACGNSDGSACCAPVPGTSSLEVTTVAHGLDTIWELAWGPDGAIWFTERGGNISRLNPATGAVTRAGSLVVSQSGEGGLMGLTFHPDWAQQPWVYVTHTYSTATGFRNRIVRMRWDGTSLGAPQALLEGIPGNSIHNGSRVVVGPDRFVYVTTGDAANDVNAQDPTSLAGKILRLTLDGAPAPGNSSGGYVYTLGHRNPQGLVFTPSGTLYATEHGPNDNDEVNRIEGGRNYGWPNVRGRCDGDAGPNEQSFCTAHSVVEPLATWTPTIAPSGLDWYGATLIPGWQGSLLFTALKGSSLHRLQLAADGKSIVKEETYFDGTYGRLRDVLVAPDGSVWLATSNRDGRGSPAGDDDRILHVRPK
ncbi:MAG: PQQ-dependent sugar dehydrogenase [Gemmatimonadaceae bacterium]